MASTGLVWLEGGHWGLTTAVYLFAAALAGGAYLAGVAAYARRDGRDGVERDGSGRDGRLAFARWSFLVALVAAAVAGVAILSHLADPVAGLLFPLTLTNFGSWITRGTWILVALGAFSALQTLWLQFGAGRADPGTVLQRVAGRLRLRATLDRLADRSRPADRRYLAVVAFGALPALGTVYTGFELSAVATVPLWHEPALLPGLFLASGVAAGVATSLAATVAFEGATGRVAVRAAGAVGLALLVSAALLWGLWSSLGGSPAAAESKALLTSGALGTPFALLAASIAVSLVASPLLAWVGYRGESALARRVARPGLVASLLVGVAGTFLLRYVVVLAAVKEPVVVVGF